MGGRALTLAALGLLLLPATAGAHRDAPPASALLPASDAPRTAAAPDSCEGDGDPFAPDKVITGELDAQHEGSYVFLPFAVPEDTTAVRVRYCYDQPETPTSEFDSHTLDLGLYEPRDDPSGPWGTDEFRGWGGSSHPDVIVSAHGFAGDERYEDDPEDQVPGRTTRAFLPGPIPAGRWAVELGLASIASRPGDSDGKVAYRVEIERTQEEFPFPRYRPAPYDSGPARSKARWYAGDLHVHGEHSALGDAPLDEVFDYAFGSLEDDKAGLDFITLSDYVSGSSWGEVGRYQEDYPRNLIVRSAEVITYQGHANSHANTAKVDYRTGPLLRRKPNGELVRLRGPRPASAIFDRVNSVGGFTQINHPTIFPSPPFPSNLCRGCPWEYSDAETAYSKVDAIEIATGPASLRDAPADPGPNPFTVTAIEFWEDALDDGHEIAAVGSSDSHNAGRTPGGITQAPIGTATTVVRADELSTRGIRRGVEAGHTYVKVTGNDAPDLRFSARRRGADRPPAIMGDTVRGEPVRFMARVLGAGPSPDPSELAYELLIVKDGEPLLTVPVTDDNFSYRFRSAGLGRYRLQLQRGTTIEAVSSPIYVKQGANPGGGSRGDGPGDRSGEGGGGEGDSDRDQDTGSSDDDSAGLESTPADAAAAGGGGSSADANALSDQTAVESGGDLPFTGLGLGALVLAGIGLLAAGLVIQRRAAGGEGKT